MRSFTAAATSSMGTFGIDAVLIKKIDPIGPQALERCFGDFADALRAGYPYPHSTMPFLKPNLVAMTT